MAGKFDDRHLHPKADAEEGCGVLPGVPHGGNHSLNPPVAKAAGYQNPCAARQNFRRVFLCHRLGVNPADIHHRAICDTRVVQRFHNGEIRIVKLGIFPHQRNFHPPLGGLFLPDHGGPLPQVGLGRNQPQAAAHRLVQPLLLKQQGDLIQRLGRGVLNHTVGAYVAEQGNFPAHVVADGRVAPAHQNVRLNAQRQKLLDGVLGGLALQLAAAGNLNDERYMDEHHAALGLLRGHLTDGLQKGLGLNVAHGAANFGNDHVGAAGAGQKMDALFDFVRNMGNHLNGAAQVVAVALAAEHRPVHLAGCYRGVHREALVCKALVVSKVQIGLCSVVRHEDLTVLIRVHGTRIHVEIWVEFLQRHLQTALLEQTAQGGRRDALAQSRDHASGYKNVFYCHFPSPYDRILQV
ncbi:hypothetical protein SDC9_95982 [bioreactor metagenome]|uniref:Uncharacterized protein n=1 Tax=bioreactor metagenome TaxID=1076179 RepID=A0A645AHX6_9ZZZZ